MSLRVVFYERGASRQESSRADGVLRLTWAEVIKKIDCRVFSRVSGGD